MKHYKSVPRSPYFERDINRLAREGYEFVSFYRIKGITCALMAKEVEDKNEKESKEEPEIAQGFCRTCKHLTIREDSGELWCKKYHTKLDSLYVKYGPGCNSHKPREQYSEVEE